MSKYIDADRLKKAVEHELDMQDLYLPVHFFEVVDGMEAADMVEVVRIGNELFIDFPNCAEIKEITLSHKGVGCSFVEENTDRELHYGRWEVKSDVIGGSRRYYIGCSVCGCEYEKDVNYCPNCGAKMDEVEE